MRLESVLFAAVLFACCNTSSTSLISTTARSLTSKQENVAAYEVGVETTKEERILHLSEFDNPIEGVRAMVSEGMEKWISMIYSAYGEEVGAYNFLRLNKQKIIYLRNERYNAWLNYVAKKDRHTLLTQAEKKFVQESDKQEILIKLLDKFKKEEFPAILRNKVMYCMVDSWTREKKLPSSVFVQLELDVKPSPGHSINLDHINVWIHFVDWAYRYRNSRKVR